MFSVADTKVTPALERQVDGHVVCAVRSSLTASVRATFIRAWARFIALTAKRN
jgi:hypothetical protein